MSEGFQGTRGKSERVVGRSGDRMVGSVACCVGLKVFNFILCVLESIFVHHTHPGPQRGQKLGLSP